MQSIQSRSALFAIQKYHRLIPK